MAGTSTKMSVDVSQFKSGIQQAQATLRTLDAELKRNEAQFKATGDKEQYMADKARILQMQMNTQKAAANQLEGALQRMRDAGVSPTSAQYQKLQTQLANTQTAMLNTSVELNDLTVSEQQAAQGADQLTQSVQGISKKISLDQVINGIGKITSTMEKAAQKAKELGQAIWDNIMDSAKWSDDTATAAMLLDMNVEDYQRYKGVFDTIGELTVADWMKAKQKVQKAIYDASDDQAAFLSLLGISTTTTKNGSHTIAGGAIQESAREWEDVFWDVVQETQRRIENKQMTQDEADTYFNAFFGKSFSNLKPLMKLGKEGFAAALEEQNVASEEAVNKMAELNDRVTKLKDDFGKLETEVLSGLAPALSKAAETLDGLLGKLLDYLQKPEGQQMLEDLGTAVSGLFEDLGNIDPEQVVSGFTAVFDKVVNGVQWIVNNKESVINALKGIVIGWGTLKLAGGALDILKLINGFKDLTGAGMTEAAASAGTAAGSAWGTAFATAVMEIAPWLAFAYTLLKPAETGDNTLGDANGNLTQEGYMNYYSALQDWTLSGGKYKDANHWIDTILEVGEMFEGLEQICDDINAVNLMNQYRIGSMDRDTLKSNLQALGYILKLTDEELIPDYDMPEEVKEVGTTGVTVKKSHTPKDLRPSTFDLDETLKTVEEAQEQLEEKVEPLEMPIEVEEMTEDEWEAFINQAQEDIGVVQIPAQLVFSGAGMASGAGGGGLMDYLMEQMNRPRGFANGIWSVPWDGYPAILHRGERVLTARENRQYTYNNNNYFGNVNLNNGLEIEALTESIDRRNRRQRSGYGAN